MRNWCRTDLYFLIRYGLKRRDIEHPWLLQRCREVQNEPNDRLDLWARFHYKSTIITFGLTIMEILASHGDDAPLCHPVPANAPEGTKPEPAELTFCILSHTGDIALGFLRQIKQEFEQNELLKQWFPDVLYADPQNESPKWSEKEGITVKRKSNPKEQTVESSGLVDGQPISRHYHRLIYDDVVTRESVNTPEQIKKTTTAWELSRALVTSKAEMNASRYAGTRYFFLDTYDTIMKRGTRPRLYAATKNGRVDGEPVLMSPALLASTRTDMGAKTFAAQMLQDPRVAEEAYFDPANHRFFERRPLGLNYYGASDFATTANGGDYTVHVVVGMDVVGNLFIVDLWREQTSTDRWMAEMVRMAKGYRPLHLWGAPKDQISRSVGPFWRERLRKTQTWVQLVPISEAGTKPEKARGFQGRHALGTVYFQKDAPWLEDLLLELGMFPVGHDDQVDALGVVCRMLDMMIGGQIPKEPEKEFARPDAGDYGSTWGTDSDEVEAWRVL